MTKQPIIIDDASPSPVLALLEGAGITQYEAAKRRGIGRAAVADSIRCGWGVRLSTLAEYARVCGYESITIRMMKKEK